MGALSSMSQWALTPLLVREGRRRRREIQDDLHHSNLP